VAAPARAHVLLETVAPPALPKVRRLLALGVGWRSAILMAISRRGYWPLARTLATQVGMSNAWLEQHGLLSIRALWMKAQGYA